MDTLIAIIRTSIGPLTHQREKSKQQLRDRQLLLWQETKEKNYNFIS